MPIHIVMRTVIWLWTTLVLISRDIVCHFITILRYKYKNSKQFTWSMDRHLDFKSYWVDSLAS